MQTAVISELPLKSLRIEFALAKVSEKFLRVITAK